MSIQRWKEQQVAAPMVSYLESVGWDVYQEVEVPGGIADIVAIAYPELGERAESHIYEVKTSWSLELLRQCLDRRQYANRVFAVVEGLGGRGTAWHENEQLFVRLGVGVFGVELKTPTQVANLRANGVDANEASVWQTTRYPPRNASPIWDVRDYVREGHKTHAKAGATNGAGRFTKFRATAEELAKLVATKPGITAADAARQVAHHYASHASARSSLVHWTKAGKVEGTIVADIDGRERFYPKNEQTRAMLIAAGWMSHEIERIFEVNGFTVSVP